MTDLDLARLREVLRLTRIKAWAWGETLDGGWAVKVPWHPSIPPRHISLTGAGSKTIARYMGTFDPPTAMALVDEVIRSREQREQCDDFVASLEAENVKLREKCETLEGYSTALEAEVEEHNSLLGLAETENEKLKARVAELEEVRSVLSNQRIPYSLGEGDD